MPRSLALDLEPSRQQKFDFRASRRAELQYGRKLRRIAQHIGDIVRELHDGTLSAAVEIGKALADYSTALIPWAAAATKRLHDEILARDKTQWFRYSAMMGKELRREIETAPTGPALQELLSEQVHLIRSLPLEAAQRVHKLTVEKVINGDRTGSIMEDILRTGHVTRSRASLIARTETSRTASLVTRVRAQHAGSTHYVWETMKDRQVRPDHKHLQGRVFEWGKPPIADERTGIRAEPGCIWSCRCFARPILPDEE